MPTRVISVANISFVGASITSVGVNVTSAGADMTSVGHDITFIDALSFSGAYHMTSKRAKHIN